MGQGASTQQQHGERDIGGVSRADVGNEATRDPERTMAFAQLRRSRRIRNSITQLSGRLMRSGSSPTLAHGSGTPIVPPSRVQVTRRPRVAFLSRTTPSSETSVSSSGYSGRTASASAVLPPVLSSDSDPLDGIESEPDVSMSDPSDAVSPSSATESTSHHPQNIGESSGGSRRSRLSRVRSTLPNLLAEIGNSRTPGNSSRRNSQAFRPGLFEPFGGSGFDDDMDVEAPSNLNTSPEPSTQRSPSDFPSPNDPGNIELQNSQVRPGEDQAAMLSRLLSVAAAMTAASLVGSSEQALTEAQDVAGDSVDGSFESFLRALQNGRLAAALRNGGNEMGGGVPSEPGSDGALAPLNFFRMFRFGSSGGNQQSAANEQSEVPPTRMVPVIIVGIRSVTPRESTNTTEGGSSSFMDQLANITNGPNRAGSRARTTDSNRRASMGALGEGQRGPGREARPASEFLPPRVPTNTNTSQSPHPPSDSGLSAFPHPNPNPTSNTPRADTVTLESAEGAQGERPQSTPHSPSAAVREDRNGAGENNSHPTSGNGSNPSQRRQGGEGTRSWIIYVLGGSYPENHPILTTPSLFTDSPTYEDMMLLSSLLGPAKPPVATREEIDSAGGLFTVTDVLPVGAGSQYRKLAEGDRCLVCLSEYEPGEECRSLAQCQHVFHKECIDTWLTTGRNSCPLCRGQGVEEKESRVQPSAADTVT